MWSLVPCVCLTLAASALAHCYLQFPRLLGTVQSTKRRTLWIQSAEGAKMKINGGKSYLNFYEPKIFILGLAWRFGSELCQPPLLLTHV